MFISFDLLDKCQSSIFFFSSSLLFNSAEFLAENLFIKLAKLFQKASSSIPDPDNTSVFIKSKRALSTS